MEESLKKLFNFGNLTLFYFIVFFILSSIDLVSVVVGHNLLHFTAKKMIFLI